MSATEWRDAPKAEFAVLGDPVGHSLSPAMHNAALAAMGIEARYVALRVPLPEFHEAAAHLRALGYRGVNATVPLKESALEWASEPDAVSTLVGAANTLDLGSGRATNTDVEGFSSLVGSLGPDPGRGALVLGAGGAARAAVAALHRRGFRVRVHSRNAARARTLAAALGLPVAVAERADPRDVGLVVNATSAGLQGLAPELEWSRCTPGTVAIDMAYGPAAGPFVAAARAFGIQAVDGLGMLVEQGALALEWWLGIQAPREVMLRAVR